MTHYLMESELILNTDGSIYHLNLLPEDIANTIILVGDPNRVKQVSKYFDRIEVQKTKREFITHTGTIGNTRITVVGTGIGGGNIDITLNELDALVNIDLKKRVIKEKHEQLRIIRLGTSGALQESVPVDSLLISSFAIGLDGLLSYYEWENSEDEKELLQLSRENFSALPALQSMYAAAGSDELISLLLKNNIGFSGITLTCPGFYGAQNRQLRAPLMKHDIFEMARKIHFKNNVVTNLEMETAAIYGLSRILGHKACSVSAIVANRYAQTFSVNPDKIVDDMIQKVLAVIAAV
jgi:uridine phosphorylase